MMLTRSEFAKKMILIAGILLMEDVKNAIKDIMLKLMEFAINFLRIATLRIFSTATACSACLDLRLPHLEVLVPQKVKYSILLLKSIFQTASMLTLTAKDALNVWIVFTCSEIVASLFLQHVKIIIVKMEDAEPVNMVTLSKESLAFLQDKQLLQQQTLSTLKALMGTVLNLLVVLVLNVLIDTIHLPQMESVFP